MVDNDYHDSSEMLAGAIGFGLMAAGYFGLLWVIAS